MQRIAIGSEIKGGLMMNVGEYVIADSKCNKTERTSRWEKYDYKAERTVTYAKRYTCLMFVSFRTEHRTMTL